MGATTLVMLPGVYRELLVALVCIKPSHVDDLLSACLKSVVCNVSSLL